MYTVTWGNPHAEWNKLSRTYQTVMRRFWYVNYTHNPNSKSEAGTQFIRKYHAWHTWETAAKWLINLKSTMSQNQILHYPPPPTCDSWNAYLNSHWGFPVILTSNHVNEDFESNTQDCCNLIICLLGIINTNFVLIN